MLLLSHFKKKTTCQSKTKKTIHCCTENKHNKLLIWCHPSYQCKGPWFAWVSVYVEQSRKRSFQRVTTLAKLLPFCQSSTIHFWARQKVIVQCAGSKTKKYSVLFEEWTLMDEYYTVLVPAILYCHIQSGHHVLPIHHHIDDIPSINNEHI
jgi:hypothetical protein